MKYLNCKIAKLFVVLLMLGFGMTCNLYSQRVGFVSSDQIRELLPDAKQADQRVQTIVDEWKRELKEIDLQIEAKSFEIQKNRLVWTDVEKNQTNLELEDLKSQRMDYAKVKYAVGGEYDQIVKAIMKPVEDKIFAAIQKVAANEGYDIVWDKSSQPMPYVNFKYDLTLKVLKELGVDTEQLEKDLDDKIKKDPRNNQEAKSQDTPTKKTRKRRTELDKSDEKPGQDENKSGVEIAPDGKNKDNEQKEEPKEPKEEKK